MSITLTPKDSSDEKERTFYIFLVFSKKKDSNIEFKFKSKKTEQIFFQKDNIPEGYRYSFILKHSCIPKKSPEDFDFSSKNTGENFKVSFNYSMADNKGIISDENKKTANSNDENNVSFIFIPNLKRATTLGDEKPINQKNAIKITDKLEIFEKFFEKENDKLRALYNDGVNFFDSNQDFELLIYLFVKFNENDAAFKEVFKKLLDIFWKKKNNEIIELLNTQNENCKNLFKDKMLTIALKEEKIAINNGLDKAKFYGFILFYFNTYDIKQFQELLKKFTEQKDKNNFFFDILVHFSSIFSNDISLSLEEYIQYLIDKKCETLEVSGFSYFKQIEDFIQVINDYKEKLIEMPKFKALKIPKQLKYNLKDPLQFRKNLNDIITFSETTKKLMIFLSQSFWKEMTKIFEKPSDENIVNLFNLRKSFKKYLDIVKLHYKKEHPIYIDAEEADGKDELAVCLNRIIQKNIEGSNEMPNDEIINQITKYDIYYKEDNYINRRELYFLDKINYDENDDSENGWIKSFKEKKFEEIFKDNIESYILKLISKINKIEDLGIVINLVNDDIIQKFEKAEYLVKSLRRKAINLLKNSESLKDPNIKNEKLSSLSDLFIIIYKYEQKFEKIQEIFDKLDNQNQHIILLKLLKSFKDSKQLQDFVFDFYVSKISINYKNIYELLEILDEASIKTFMANFSDKKDEKKKDNRIISYDNFFMEKDSLNLNLFQELIDKVKNKIEKTKYYGDNKKILENIYNSIETKKLEIKYLKTLLSFPEENVIKRLNLLTILKKAFNPKNKFEDLSFKYNRAKKEIGELKKISEALKVFHRDSCRDTINEIEKTISNFNDGKINEFDNIDKLTMEYEGEIKTKVEDINKVKESTIFRELFINSKGSNQNEKFKNALKDLPEEFKKRKANITQVDEKTKQEFQIIMKAIGLEGDQKTENEIKYIENSSSAEEDIKNMIYFCENFKLDNDINDNNDNNDINQNEEGKDEDLETILHTTYDNIINTNNNDEKKKKFE